KGISQKSLSSLMVTVPSSLPEQTAIGDFFSTLDRSIALHQRELENLKNPSYRKCFQKMVKAYLKFVFLSSKTLLLGNSGSWEILVQRLQVYLVRQKKILDMGKLNL
ncbi:restriction endonuclease subunit S, partial [Streptococcus intermedius]|uniref:restriction endonuclease subunit S n=1 Tax=Streptococcus intermedius TaxID=1338 RepID=UPI0039C035B8